jgi:DNA polymerase-3 subunit epsilon
VEPRRQLFFDFETTGIIHANLPEAHESQPHIVQVAALLIVDGREVSSIDVIVDPGNEIPIGAAKIHGITTEKARAEGRPLGDVVPEVET